jgi:aminoglycoside 6'-N-acetyltransferase
MGKGLKLGYRRLQRWDLPLLAAWLAAPHVAEWWRIGSDPRSIEVEYGAVVDGPDPTEVFIVEDAGTPIGLLQRYLLQDNPDWRDALAQAMPVEPAAGIDYFIGRAAYLGRGIGSQMIRDFTVDTWARWPEIRSIVVSVQQSNTRSWRALESADFLRTWAGVIVSNDPSDDEPSFVYVCNRPQEHRAKDSES